MSQLYPPPAPMPGMTPLPPLPEQWHSPVDLAIEPPHLPPPTPYTTGGTSATTAAGYAVPASWLPPGQGPHLDRIIDASRVDRARIVVLRDGIPVEILPVVEGRVTVEAERSPRRTLEATIWGDPWWVPSKIYHPLDVRSNIELRAENGIIDPATGSEYWWSLGVFQVRSARITNERNEVKIEVTAPDRSAARRWPMEGGIAIASGTSVEDACAQILGALRSPIDIVKTPTGHYLPFTILGKVGDDGWLVARELAASVGFDLAYDVYGAPRLTQLVDPAKVAPTMTWHDVDTSSSLLSMSREIEGADMVDGIIVPWSGGTLYHPSILSNFPALWEGDSSLILNEDQARKAAAAELLRREGLVETVNFSRWSDPRREVGEIVKIIDPATETNFAARITGLGFGLARPTMEVRLANRRVV